MRAIPFLPQNIQIRHKLMISYILVVFIPVLIVGVLLTQSLKRITLDHAIQQTVNNAEKMKKHAEDLLKIPIEISNKIYFDRNLKNLVDSRYDSLWDVVNAYHDYRDFEDFLRLYKEVSGIRFYSDNATLLNNWTFFRIDDATRNAAWFQEGLQNRGKNQWLYISDPTRSDMRYLSLVREIFFDNMTFCGLLVITMNPDNLADVVSQEPFDTFIVTDRNEVIAAKDSSSIGKSLEQIRLTGQFQSSAKDGLQDVQYLGRPAKAIMEPIEMENSKGRLRIISIIPTEAITKETKQVSDVAFSIILTSLLLSIGMILFFSGILSKRIRLLSKDIRMAAMGHLSRISIVEGKDEIGQLGRHFNFMTRSIKDLMNEVAEADRQKNDMLIKQKEIKLKMLANQVNPHFLFNVLETIRMRAHSNGDKEIANTVKSLGKLLRHNLEIGQEPVPLSEELLIVSSYLDIQKFRFGDKIDYTLPDPEETVGYTIIPMVLQPIVENAIVHGLENKEGKGTLTVRFEADDSATRLIVFDDGIGITAEKLESIGRMLEEPDDGAGRRIGLRNVHQRLRLLYGPEYGLQIESGPGAGTRVIIAFPAGGNVRV